MLTVPVEYIVENIEGIWYQLENPVANHHDRLRHQIT